jgi:ubiquinone biosynthesis protein
MANAVTNLLRLARAGLVLSEHGASFVPKGDKVPWPLTALRMVTAPLRLLMWPFRGNRRKDDAAAPIAAALTRLGPSYIKLGQFMATRRDLIDPSLAKDLSTLQDRLPPFPLSQARAAIEEALGDKVEALFTEIGPPLAAASIAQVHKAFTADATLPRRAYGLAAAPAETHPRLDVTRRAMAVKILRPGVEKRFASDLESFYFAARLIERWYPPIRRLKPVAVVDTLARSVQLEMDLRLEAAAISEMADNIKSDMGFRVPQVDWQRTAKRVLTIEWIDGIPIGDSARLRAEGHDLKRLGELVIQSFLRHAMRDGFFHADMHQGNLFVDPESRVVAVDFGIMGRLGARERRFLAEILYGFISRDYQRAAEIHFWAGYVPPHHPVETFAQALRAVGEPIQGRPAEEISMAGLLGQLFQYTEVFDMQTRPELIMLQKTMVAVEGVARGLDPSLNMWTVAEPVVKEWMERELGTTGRLREAGEGMGQTARFLAGMPELLQTAESAFRSLAVMASRGIRLDEETVRRLATEERRQGRWGRRILWTAAGAIAAYLTFSAL